MKNELSARLTVPISELSVMQSQFHAFPMTVCYEAKPEEAALFDFPPEKASGSFTVYVERSGRVKAHASDGCHFVDAFTKDGYHVRVLYKEPDKLTEGDRIRVRRLH